MNIKTVYVTSKGVFWDKSESEKKLTDPRYMVLALVIQLN